MYKNIDKNKVLALKDEMKYLDGQVSSKTIVQNERVSITLFSFDKNEEIGLHTSKGDALVTILEGTSQITVGNEIFVLSEGQTLIMPANIPHALFAKERFKMYLCVVF